MISRLVPVLIILLSLTQSARAESPASRTFNPVAAGPIIAQQEQFENSGPWSDYDAEPSPPQTRDVSGAPVFRAIIKLIKLNYVKDVPDDAIFLNPARKLIMTLPPLCAQEIPDVRECGGAPEQCLLDTIYRVASVCGMDPEKVCRRVFELLLRDLDPNTCLMDAAMVKELTITTSGKFGGVGVMVSRRDGDYVVISPFEGSPAHRAGIRAGDVMLEIDGRSLHDLPLLEVLRMVRGPVGSFISLTVKSAKTGEIRHVRLRRKTIVIPPVRSVMLPDKIGYLRVVNFQEGARTEMEKAIRRLLSRSGGRLNGLILDLRDNPGGLLDQATKIANLFINRGAITSLRGRNSRFNKEFSAEGPSLVAGTPLAVLINKGTASSSEILAGALQGKPNVTIMGERSFGKASVQAVYPLGGGAALRLTTAHYYTAEGRDIEGTGLEPDIPIEESPDRTVSEKLDPLDPNRLQEDPWIERALELLRNEKSAETGTFPTLY